MLLIIAFFKSNCKKLFFLTSKIQQYMINYIYGDVMDRITFILIAIAYYILTIVSVIVILNVLNNKEKKKLKKRNREVRN